MVKGLTVATLLAALAISACQSTGGSFCDISKPIRLSPELIDQLSDQEVADLLGINERGQRLCGWNP